MGAGADRFTQRLRCRHPAIVWYWPDNMRILYGVVGEGMGHAIRSRVVLEHLLERGHELEIMASSRAAQFLRRHFGERAWVHRIHGMHIDYRDNRVQRRSTLWSNLIQGGLALPRQLAAYFELLAEFRAELVISDFDSWTYLYARMRRLPIISIDNMQVINRCAIDDEVIADQRGEFELTRAFVKSKLPYCDHYFISSFFPLPVRKPHTTLVPPVLRPEILTAQARRGDHWLIYQTAEGYDALLDALRRRGVECRVYGMRRGSSEDVVEQNLRFRPFSEASFIEDLATARAVIAGGGFTLLGEAVYLKKPVLAVPVQGQFEQFLNARYIQRLGYGRCSTWLDDGALTDFADALPSCEDRLQSYSQDGNRQLLDALDAGIAAGRWVS
jgi:uncharacterized protein (TIGR00661 family)